MKDYIKIVRFAKPKLALVNQLSEFQRGWICGLIDGDGGLHFSQTLNDNYEHWVHVTNTNLRMLEILADLVGQGFIALVKEETRKTKACYRYILKPRHALITLLGNLKLYDKDTQRKLMLEALYILDGLAKDPQGKRVEAIEKEIKQLNQRGPTRTRGVIVG